MIEAHRAYIAAQLKVGVTVATVHQGLVDEHGLVVSVASLRRWVRANLPEVARRGGDGAARVPTVRAVLRRRSTTGSWDVARPS